MKYEKYWVGNDLVQKSNLVENFLNGDRNMDIIISYLYIVTGRCYTTNGFLPMAYPR
jgi:hypothetical protein